MRPGRPATGQAEHTAGPPEDSGFQPLPQRQVVLTMVGVMLALFLASLDQTVVGTAMPRIIANLGGFDRYTWVTTAYLVASTAVVPIVGRLTDMYGRKWFFVAGIAIFLVGSVLAGFSQSMNQLIAFRALQGVGGGVMMANAFVVVGDLFPLAERGKWGGLVSAAFGLSSIVGPTLGGYVTDNLSWHWVFFINLPLGIPVAGLFIRFFPHLRPAARTHHLDYLGVMTLVLAVVPLLLGLSWGGVQYPWLSPQIIGTLAFAATMAALFVLVELRSAEPLIPMALFRNGVVSISFIAIFMVGFGMFGAIIFVPLFFQGVLGVSATSSGSFLTPMMLGTVVGSTLSGQALSRLGGHYRLQGLTGLALVGTGVFLLSRLGVATSYHTAVLDIVIVGLGMGITFPVFVIAVQNAVPYAVMGVATSTTQFVRSIGGSVGLAILGSLMASQFSSSLAAGLPPAVKAALPPERLAQLTSSPQALMKPDALSGLQAVFGQMGPQGAILGQQFMQALREALATAINHIFLVGLGAIALAFLATLFLKEVPLRKRGPAAPRPAPAPVGGAGDGQQANR